MVTRRRKRRGAVWTAVVLTSALGLAALGGTRIAGPGALLPGFMLLGVGLVLIGAPAARRSGGSLRAPRIEESDAVPAPQAVEQRAPLGKRTLIVGTNEVAQALAREFERSGTHHVLGFVADGPRVTAQGEPLDGANGLRVLGTRDGLLDLADTYRVEEIIIAEAPSWQQQLMERALERGSLVTVKLVPSLYETAIGRLPRQRVKDIPLLSLAPWERSRAYEVARRAFDVVFSLAALILSAPLMLLAAAAIKLSSRGPVLFRQERVGLDGRTFTMMKLRTMVLDAERDGPSLCSGYDDRRLTAVGRLLRKTRLDELPQFVDVLRGEMSVIGPRPERPCFVARFEQQIPGYQERHRIRPGITGLAQVNGHYLSSARDKLRYDLFYLYHRSFWLDARIVLRTFTAMIH